MNKKDPQTSVLSRNKNLILKSWNKFFDAGLSTQSCKVQFEEVEDFRFSQSWAKDTAVKQL
jgi:hypothetical protein